MSALTVSGSGTLSTLRGGPGFTDSLTQSGSGTISFTLVSATALAQMWNGTAWQPAPIWTWTGSAWQITTVQIIRSDGPPVHGMYAGPGSAGSAAIDAFNAAHGIHVILGHDIADSTSWQTMTDTTALNAWNTWCGAVPARRLIYSIPMLTDTDDSSLAIKQKYQNLAFGLYDAYFSSLGAAFQSLSNLRDATIKIGPRFNYFGHAWSVPSGDQDAFDLYVAGYNRIAALMKQVCPTLTFEWTPNFGLDGLQRNLADLYPGDDFVDYIGLTLSDARPDSAGVDESQTDRFAWLQSTTNGLNDQVALAAARGKYPTLSTWSLVPANDPSNGGGDDPAFVDLVVSWMLANSYAYSVYNNTNLINGNIDSRLIGYPSAQAEYVAQFLVIGG